MLNLIHHLFRQLKQRQQGVTALEFAIVAPVFFLVLLGSLEMGFMLMADAALERAAHQVTREARIQYRGKCTGEMETQLKSHIGGWVPSVQVTAQVLHRADESSNTTNCGGANDLVQYDLRFGKVSFIGVLNFLDFKPTRTVIVQNEPYDGNG